MGLSPLRVNFPDPSQVFKDKPDEQRYLQQVAQTSRAELEARTRDDVARTSILLQAPDNSVWALSVSAAGVVTTTRVR